MKPAPLTEITQRIEARLLRPPEGGGVDPLVTGVSTDSRTTSPGDLFFALSGPNFDGHDFVAQAMASGAVAAVVGRDLAGLEGLLLVEDPLRALGALAAHHRQSLPGKVIAVTGSTGKTTVKAMVGLILGRKMTTVVSEENYNNEIGVPLTLLRADEHSEAIVLELAMRAPGEIRYLTEMAHPDIGAITNIGPSHIGRLGSLEAVAQAKAELFEGMPDSGIAVVNGEDLFADFLLEAAGHLAERITFGLSPEADVRAERVEARGLEGLRFLLIARGRSVWVRLPLIGRHHVLNALCAAAIVLSMGLETGEIAAGLAEFGPQPGRGQLRPVSGGVVLIDDAYNASPVSVGAALRALEDLPVEGRRWAVLGDMLELGEWAEESHRTVGVLAADVGVDRLVAVGELSRGIVEGAVAGGMARDQVSWFATAEEAAAMQDLLQPKDVVLVKASHAVNLGHLVETLAAAGDAYY